MQLDMWLENWRKFDSYVVRYVVEVSCLVRHLEEVICVVRFVV